MSHFRILSLDGGGTRGYLSIHLLANIEKYLNNKNNEQIPLGQRFDLIVGTSTGAIIGGLLAIGKSAQEIAELYEADIPEIFNPKQKRGWFSCLIRPKYDNQVLIKRANQYFKNLTFNDVKTDLIVTSVDITQMQLRLHKSAFIERNKIRADEKLANAIIASTSAPTFFPVARKLDKSDYLIDGGITANNPAMVGLLDALDFDRKSKRGIQPPENFNDILLLSIGTGKERVTPYNVNALLKAGLYRWARPLIELLMASQAKLVEYQVGALLNKTKAVYKRLNPDLTAKMPLDDINFSLLTNLADLKKTDTDWLDQYFKENNK